MSEHIIPTAPEAAVAALPVPSGDSEVATLREATQPLLSQARAIEIIDEASDAVAKEMLAQASKAVRRIEALRKRWTKPILDHKRAIDSDFGRMIDPVRSAERILREKVALYAMAEQRRLRDAAAGIDRADGLEVVPAAPSKVTTESGTVTMRSGWDFTIIDAAQVPAEYKTVDPTKVRSAVKAGVRNIPGVDIFETRTAVVR
jgi:hypothetical protein